MKRISLISNQLKNNQLPSNYSLITITPSEKNSKIKIITMISHNNLNALTNQLCDELISALDYLSNDDSTKIVILTGSGKSFIAGADIKTLSNLKYKEKLMKNQSLHQLPYAFSSFRKPIIAAVNGICFGGGFETALLCDIILASDKAQFGFPEIKLGLFPGMGGTQNFTKIVGYHKACEYIMTGKNIDINECLRLGVVSFIYKHEELMGKAEEMSEILANYSILALINAKSSIKMSREVGLSQGLSFEKSLFDSHMSFDDVSEGTNAFLNKRKAVFKDN